MPAPVQLRFMPAGFALREGIGSVRVVPWTAESSFSLAFADADHPKFKIRRRRKWSNDWKVQPNIDPETAKWIATRVQSWIAKRKATLTDPSLLTQRSPNSG
jgi:hypothetical protein